MQIGNLEVKPGEVKQGWLAVEGCCYELPMTVICGGTGKVTLITGGVHNAEYVGIQAAVELGSNEIQNMCEAYQCGTEYGTADRYATPLLSGLCSGVLHKDQ